jgi:hypothetical protein
MISFTKIHIAINEKKYLIFTSGIKRTITQDRRPKYLFFFFSCIIYSFIIKNKVHIYIFMKYLMNLNNIL